MNVTDKITITNEDNMELMARYPDKYFDLAIVDPPYGIGVENFSMGQNKNREDGYNRGDSTAVRLKKERYHSRGKLKNRAFNKMNMEWDNHRPSDEYFQELFRVCKNIIIWGGNYFDLSPTRCIICWDKCQPWDNFSQWEMAWTSFDKPASIFRYSNTGGANGEKKIHPTQKPVALYKWLLDKYAKPNDKILDTHLGSGSIAIACHDYDFELTACELDTDYFNSAVTRIQEHVKIPIIRFPEPEIIHQTNIFEL